MGGALLQDDEQGFELKFDNFQWHYTIMYRGGGGGGRLWVLYYGLYRSKLMNIHN